MICERVETTLIVNYYQSYFSVDIWLKININLTYVHCRCFKVDKTTLKNVGNVWCSDLYWPVDQMQQLILMQQLRLKCHNWEFSEQLKFKNIKWKMYHSKSKIQVLQQCISLFKVYKTVICTTLYSVSLSSAIFILAEVFFMTFLIL